MSGTIIYVRTADFNKPDLPRVQPFSVNGFLAEKLKCAFKPRGNAASLIDLSGNNTSVTLKGSPVWLDTGLKGNVYNGYRLAALDDTASVTLMHVARQHRSMNADNSGSFDSGDMALGFNCFRGGQAVDPAQGLTAYLAFGAASSGNADQQRSQLRTTHLIKSALDGTIYSLGRARTFTADFTTATFLTGQWIFACVTIDAAIDRSTTYVFGGEDVLGGTAYIDSTTSSYVGPGSFANRPLGTPFCLHLSDQDGFTNDGPSEVAACAAWGRALSTEEVVWQYNMLKEDLSRNRGIVI